MRTNDLPSRPLKSNTKPMHKVSICANGGYADFVAARCIAYMAKSACTYFSALISVLTRDGKTPSHVPRPSTIICDPGESVCLNSSEKPQRLPIKDGRPSTLIGLEQNFSRPLPASKTWYRTSIWVPTMIANIIGPPDKTARLPMKNPKNGAHKITKLFLILPLSSPLAVTLSQKPHKSDPPVRTPIVFSIQ